MKHLRPYQVAAIQECWDALKKDNSPVLLMASVGSGKSLMLSSILLTMQKMGKKCLCLVNNAELVRNNCETFREQGGSASIYCAALGSKDISQSTIFGTPVSVLNAIKNNEPLSDIIFNLIVVDEAHGIDYSRPNSSFMRVLRHYKQQYRDLRVLGATGTNFRYKGTKIVGDDCFFKSQVGNISTSWLIKNNYLVNPVYHLDENLLIDFSKVKIKQNGQFDYKELEDTVSKNVRLTELIMKQLIHVMEKQNRFGVFIFASTKKHAYECASHLPSSETAVILGDMPVKKRIDILNKARKSEIKYLVNINIISVGVDVPGYDTVAYLRPTESLVLMTQTLGRGLRLYDGKKQCLVLDFAGNIHRHRDWDDPLLIDALQQVHKDKELIFKCPVCCTMNGEWARRCIGIQNHKRCDFYFEFKTCHKCQTNNDLVARHCRSCNAELIDPNAKLSFESLKSTHTRVEVLKAKYSITGAENNFRLNVQYMCTLGIMVYEFFNPCSSEKAKNVFYGKFVRPAVNNSSRYYPFLTNYEKMKSMLNDIKTPQYLDVTSSYKGFVIHKKHFALDTPLSRPLQHQDLTHIPPDNPEQSSWREILAAL